jgi:hypothetical protein
MEPDVTSLTAGTMVSDLWDPFLLYVLEARRGDDREADEEDVGLGVGEGAETVVVFLAWWGLERRDAERSGPEGSAAERDEEGEGSRRKRGE